jgi:phosphoserine phosphatase RsbU/P
MPEMDGYEVCRQLKANPKSADIPVLFISALDDISDKMRAFSAGGVDYITKPFQLEEVVARVETHLALRRLQRNLQERQPAHGAGAGAGGPGAGQLHAAHPARGARLAAGGGADPGAPDLRRFLRRDPAAHRRLALLIADVVDKGVGAALYMAMSCALLRAYTGEHPDDPDLACRAVNERLLAYATADQFVTLFLAILDPGSGALVYSNAGHNPPILLRAAEPDHVVLLRNTGMPLGVSDDGLWPSQLVQLQAGDVLVMYTDGVTDAESAEGEFYDLQRLAAIVQTSRGSTAQGLKDAILDDVRRFTRGAAQSDDMALMVLVRQ